MKSFWEKLQKPIFALAPMADVTDCAFRQIIAKYGKPPVFWTEFVSADGLAHPKAREKLLIDLKYGENEHPIVAQIFGGKPENIRTAAILCRNLGFDGIDINMGCPDRSVEKQCAGAAMMKDPKLAKEIIRAAKDSGLPVSVKTRIGYNKNEIATWVRTLLEEDLAVLTVHLRTRKEMSNVPAHWEVMKDIVAIRDEMKKDTLIFGNGDVADIDDAGRKYEKYGGDGVMLGKAIFGNPWLFSKHTPTLEEKLKVMVEHTKLFEEMLMHPNPIRTDGRKRPTSNGTKSFAIMKKHYKAYAHGFEGAKELRMALMEAKDAGEVEKITLKFLKSGI
ncbi:MAG: tRNA-dihydrouridine synthase [Patescibacteria group bacterium]